MKNAVIILPTYNEAGTIDSVVKGVFDQQKKTKKWTIHVLVVDSQSNDGTGKKVKELQKEFKNLHLLSTKKEGLGKAYISGFKYALDELDASVVFEMDADTSHDPDEIPNFLQEIEQGSDFVIGSRYIKGGSIPQNWALHRKLFSIIGNVIIRLGFMKIRTADWTSGYRAIKKWVLMDMLSSLHNYSGYVFQVAVLDNAIKKSAQIKEIPIQFTDRVEGNSKIDSFQFIVQTLIYVFLNSSFVKFFIVGGTGFVIDSLLLFFFALILHFPPWLSKFISAETVILFNFTMNNFWSFAHKQLDGRAKSYVKGAVKFNLVSLGNIAIQVTGVQILSVLFGKEYILFYNAGIIILFVIPYSYFFYNKFIWKNK